MYIATMDNINKSPHEIEIEMYSQSKVIEELSSGPKMISLVDKPHNVVCGGRSYVPLTPAEIGFDMILKAQQERDLKCKQ